MTDKRTEGEIQDATVKELRKLGFGVWITSQGRKTHSTPGIADLIVMGRGRVVFMEMKPPSGRRKNQEPEQVEFQRAVEANGGEYVVIRSEMEAIEHLAYIHNGR